MINYFLENFQSNWSATLTSLKPWLPLLAIATLVEIFRPGRKLKAKSTIGNFIYLPVALTLGATILGPAIHWGNMQLPHDIIHLRSFSDGLLGGALVWIAYLALFDFFYYWFHRAQHQIPFMWKFHMVHHTDENVSASSVGRHHWLEEGFRYFFITAPLIIIMGDSSQMPILATSYIIFNGVLMHWNTSFRFGLLEKIIITPAYHRIHHSIEEKHFDKNFGVFTQTWDNLFKTRHIPTQEEYPATGVSNISEEKALALLLPWPVVLQKSENSPPKNNYFD